MPVLSNPRHELFAQELAAGRGITEAYVLAGYRESPGAATRLAKKVKHRVDEILQAAADEAAKRLEISKERVLRELAKIGFADIRKAVEWHGELLREEDNPDGGDILVIKHIFSNHVRLKSSNEIDDDTAGAIAEVRQTKEGVSIKFHDKRAALIDIGKHIGMFRDEPEENQADHVPLHERLKAYERAEQIEASDGKVVELKKRA